MAFTISQIKFFAQDSEIVEDRVCVVQDVKKGNGQRTGDIAGMRVKDENNTNWKVFIEAKNAKSQQYLKDGLTKFFSHAEGRKEKKEIFVYLSYYSIENPPKKSKFDKKNKKLYIIIDGIKKDDFTLDIKFLSTPNSGVTMQQLLEKLKINSSNLHGSKDLAISEKKGIRFSYLNFL